MAFAETILTGRNNYWSWRVERLQFAKAEGYHKCFVVFVIPSQKTSHQATRPSVEPSVPASQYDDAEQDKLEGKARLAITRSVSLEIRTALETIETAAAAWKYLQNLFGRTSEAMVDLLNHRLRTLKVTTPRVSCVFTAVTEILTALHHAGHPVDCETAQRAVFRMCRSFPRPSLVNYVDSLSHELSSARGLDVIFGLLFDRELELDTVEALGRPEKHKTDRVRQEL